MPTPYIMIKTEVDVTEIRYIHSIWLRREDLNLLTPIDYVPIVQKHEEARTASLTFLREALAER